MTKLTKARRARLDKLATYLESLPKRYRHFDMSSFIKIDVVREKTEAEYGRTNGGVTSCGTAACAAGHGPAAGILAPPRMVDGDHIDWGQYCTLFTGQNDDDEDFLFSGGWSVEDDHHYGAAARIRYLLDHGHAPTDWEIDEETVQLYAPYRIDAKVPA